MIYSGKRAVVLGLGHSGEAAAILLREEGAEVTICESSDILGRDRMLPELAAGDLVAITGAGAYGAVMASGYNSRPSAAEVMVAGECFAVVRPSLGIERQFADERIPDWLGRTG